MSDSTHDLEERVEAIENELGIETEAGPSPADICDVWVELWDPFTDRDHQFRTYTPLEGFEADLRDHDRIPFHHSFTDDDVLDGHEATGGVYYGQLRVIHASEVPTDE